ncbi:MAG: hydrogenase maturation nickel metallochaperone HypA [Oscillospiraceae bacterium]
MHELALTEGIISIVESEKKKHGFERVSEISLKLGEYSGVIPECMEEFFPIASKGTAAAGAKLRFEKVPAEFECRGCDWRGGLERGALPARSAAGKTSK